MHDHIENIIAKLISLKSEGAHWDFKRKHHSNKAKLVHDILCLANAVTQCDKFLIFGVEDHSFEIIGLKEGELKNASDVYDTLKKIKFLDGVRPRCVFHTIELGSFKLQAIQIKDADQKPYLLSEDYCDGKVRVSSHVVHCRTEDTNSPISEGANYDQLIKIWSERFKLNLKPEDMMLSLLLTPENWLYDFDEEKKGHHEFHTEYRIEISDSEQHDPFYRLFYSNKKSYLATANFIKGSTKLFHVPIVYLDERRVLVPKPEIGRIQVNDQTLNYFFYNLDTKAGRFLHFLTEGCFDFSGGRFAHDLLLVFKNSEEIRLYESFIHNHSHLIDEYETGALVKSLEKEASRNNHDTSIFNPKNLFWLSSMKELFNQRTFTEE